jgi:uncharacterized protein
MSAASRSDRTVVAPDASALQRALDAHGWARIPDLLAREECHTLRALLDDDAQFRTRIDMARHHYGAGSYGYLRYPLPELVARLRAALYPPLAAIANRWSEALGQDERYPAELDAFLEHCQRAGQRRPTPLLLRYGADGYNRMHQDLYGDVAFPLQVVVLLSEPDREFAGGEFLVSEQRPRSQSRVEVVRFAQGEGIAFANAWRPVPGARGPVRAAARHGLARVTHGERFALGLIFHDAR